MLKAFSIPACFLVMTFACSALADEYVKIGAWNIENLGGREYGQIPAALAEHIQLSDVDILALEEIWDTDDSPETRTNSKLDETFQRINEEPGNDWTYLIFENRTPDRERHTGVAWNRKAVSLIGEPLKIDVTFANDATWNRWPHAVKFSVREGKTDFVVIPLHMKSNRVDDTMPDLPATDLIRKQEAEALVEKLPDVREHFGDQDIVLLGDTNCLKEDEPALAAFTAAGFVDLNSKNAITYSKGMYLSPFDRILIPEGQQETRFSQQYVLAPTSPTDHLRRYSDHYLVLTALRVLNDDD
jgi:endonuclease/exonuclease/phosphatase family metal-dependent hydrolase